MKVKVLLISRTQKGQYRETGYVVTSDTDLFFRLSLLRTLPRLEGVMVCRQNRGEVQAILATHTRPFGKEILFDRADMANPEKVEELAYKCWQRIIELGDKVDRTNNAVPRGFAKKIK